LLHDTRHTLLVLDDSAATAERRLAGHLKHTVRVLTVGAEDTATRRAYPAGVCLVRPDGYLAAIGLDAADAYLRRVFRLP